MKTKLPPTGLRAAVLLTLSAVALCGSIGSTSAAEKFKTAEVTKVVNDVRLVTSAKTTRPASRGSVVSGSAAVRTGQKSRAELQFPDDSIVRLGSNSLFSFLQGKREVDLKQGTLLMQVPKSLGRTRVKTAAISAAITGTTILIEFIPAVLDEDGNIIKHGTIKIIVIEGSLEFSLNIAPRRTLKLVAGEMVALRSDAKKLPQKFQIDLELLIETSLLMDGGMGALALLQAVDQEVANQNGEKRRGRLLAKNGPRDSGGGGLLARLFAGKPINRARDVINSRPPLPPATPPAGGGGGGGGGNNNNNNLPPSTAGGAPPIQLPDRPDRNPPGGGPTS